MTSAQSAGAGGPGPGGSARARLRGKLRDVVETSVLGLEAMRPLHTPAHRLPDGSQRIYCYHIRKTGGTSLHRSFLGLGGEDPAVVERRLSSSFLRRTSSGDYVYAVNLRRVLEQGRYFYGWSHLPAHTLQLPPGTFTVSILRDPVRRVESYYNYMLTGDAPGTAFTVPDVERRRARNGFHGLLDSLPREVLLRQLFMFSADFDVSEAVERASQCSMLFFNEDYDRGLAELSRRLQLPLEIRHDRAGGTKAALSSDELDRLRTLLEPEYQLIEQLRDSRQRWLDANTEPNGDSATLVDPPEQHESAPPRSDDAARPGAAQPD